MKSKPATLPPPSPAVTGSTRSAAIAWIARRDAGLTPAEEQELQRWLDADPAHGAALARYGSVWAAMDRPRRSGAACRVMTAVQLHTTRRQRSARRAVVLAGGIAAVLLVGLFLRDRSARPETSTTAVANATVILPRREVLPDGSTLELKDGTEVAVGFTSTLRRVSLLRGEAHFEVAKDPQRPFVVTAGRLEIRAVGTAFAVELAAEQVQVLVTEGRVAVHRPAADAQNSEATASDIVDAGNRLVVETAPTSAVQPAVAVSTEEVSRLLAWREARLEFTGTPLADAVAMLNQRNAIQLIVADETIARIRVSGLFRARNVDDFVQILEAGFGVKAEHRSATEIVLRNAR